MSDPSRFGASVPENEALSRELPLYGALAALAERRGARLHMPGHKGLPLPGDYGGYFDRAVLLDYTELGETGDLFGGKGPVARAGEEVKRVFGLGSGLMLASGSTGALHALLKLACPAGSTVLCDRNLHRSVWNGMALCDLRPVFLEPLFDPAYGLTRGFSPDALRAGLARHRPSAVIATSPTYCGALLDVGSIAAEAHAAGARLIVDEAHGAHLPFLDGTRSALSQGADFAAFSLHKTLPALGGAAVAAAARPGLDGALRESASVFCSTSPSFAVLASIDLARRYAEREGREELKRAARMAGEFRARLRETGRFVLPEGAGFDPLRLTVKTPYHDGESLERALSERELYPEMLDGEGLVAIVTPAELANGSLSRLADCLLSLERARDEAKPFSPPPPLPEAVLSPREALFREGKERIPLERAAGRIAAELLAPYPPGVPVAAPGERLEEAHISFLSARGFSLSEEIRVFK